MGQFHTGYQAEERNNGQSDTGAFRADGVIRSKSTRMNSDRGQHANHGTVHSPSIDATLIIILPGIR